jgi:UDP-2,4-diacetamido-2,4,6-trideoxy-beta-L-altropyranose hydrolase
MEVVVRADASTAVGTGHVMRCLTLCDALRSAGAVVRFICRQADGHLGELITERGYAVTVLTADATGREKLLGYERWLGVPLDTDAEQTIAAIAASKVRPDWLIADHYALDSRWEQRLRPNVRRIMAIDDLADRTHDCDILLDQNLISGMSERYRDKVPKRCRLLMGPDFALLRGEFARMRATVALRTGPVRRLLVFLGGADSANYTMTALDAVGAIGNPRPEVDVVIGVGHRMRAEIDAQCRARGFTCHVQSVHMAELMANADLAIGAGGSASWERCCVGLPALIVSMAANQVVIGQNLEDYGACVYLGNIEAVSAEKIRQELENLLSNPAAVQRLSARAYALVDGRGTERVIEALRQAA